MRVVTQMLLRFFWPSQNKVWGEYKQELFCTTRKQKMDFIVAATGLRASRKKKESFDGGSSSSAPTSSSVAADVVAWVWGVFVALIGLALSVLAVYLSWTCGTKQNLPTVTKVILAIVAALFSVIYIIVHFVLVFVTNNSNGRFQPWCSAAAAGAAPKRTKDALRA